MGEWEDGLDVARERGIIDVELRDRLATLEFDREPKRQGFPMRIALIVLGVILLLSPMFAVAVRVLGPDPSQVLIALVLVIIGLIVEAVALLVRRAKSLSLLAGIIGSFAGVPFGFALGVVLPDNPSSAAGAAGTMVAAIWSLLWYRRTKSGIPIGVVIGELAVFIGFVGEWAHANTETTGIVLCGFGVVCALGSIFGRLKPGLPPLVSSLVVVGIGSLMQNRYGGGIATAIGFAISGLLFLLTYRRAQALMAAATAISTGVWGVALAGTLTTGALAPVFVAAVIGSVLIIWGLRLSRKQQH